MHFKIKRLKLLNALSKATRAVSVRSPLPVLTGIKFDLKSDQLILTGSDSDITIQTIIDQDDDLEIIKEGAVVLNSRYIFDIVRKINSDDIEISKLPKVEYKNFLKSCNLVITDEQKIILDKMYEALGKDSYVNKKRREMSIDHDDEFLFEDLFSIKESTSNYDDMPF